MAGSVPQHPLQCPQTGRRITAGQWESPMFTYVQRFLLYLEDEQARSANTTAAYRNDLSQFTKYVKERCDDVDHPTIHCWRQVDENIVQSYLIDLKQRDYASATVARKVACIKSFFHWMQTCEGYTVNPAQTLEAPRVKKLTPRPIRPQEIERLLAEPARVHSAQALRDSALIETLYASGMRVTEVVGLNLANVDLATGQIQVGDAREDAHHDPHRLVPRRAHCVPGRGTAGPAGAPR